MHWFSKKRILIPMLLPTVALYLTYVIWPVFVAARYSLTKFDGITQPEFVGLANYKRLLDDPNIATAFTNTAIALLFGFFILLPLSFGVAFLLEEKVRASALHRAMIFAPNVVSPILVALLWIFILDPKIGAVNGLLRALGLGDLQQQWIGGETLTPYSVGLIFVWQQLGFCTAIYMAGLAMVPRDVYEAASVDGANPWQRIRHITIPLVSGTTKIVLTLIVIGVLRIFETVYQLTGGGPVHASEVITTYMYAETFRGGNYGYGMAIAVVILGISIACSVAYVRSSLRTVEAR